MIFALYDLDSVCSFDSWSFLVGACGLMGKVDISKLQFSEACLCFYLLIISRERSDFVIIVMSITRSLIRNKVGFIVD